MTERQVRLVKCYGPRFVDRSGEIMDEFLHLEDDALSVMTADEWKDCAWKIDEVVKELNRLRELMMTRIKEAGVSV